MALFKNGFEAGTTAGDGVSVTTGNSGYTGGNAFTIVSAGTPNTIKYSIANKMQGAYGGLFTQDGVTTSASILQLADSSGASSFAARVYYNLMGGSWPTIGFGIQVRSTTDGLVCTLQFDTTGKMQVRNNVGVLGTGTVVTPNNANFRLEFTGTGVGTAATTLTAKTFSGESTTALDTVTVTGVTTTGTPDRARIGKIGTGTMSTFIADSFALSIGTSAFLGPEVQASSDYIRKTGTWQPHAPFVRRSGVWV